MRSASETSHKYVRTKACIRAYPGTPVDRWRSEPGPGLIVQKCKVEGQKATTKQQGEIRTETVPHWRGLFFLFPFSGLRTSLGCSSRRGNMAAPVTSACAYWLPVDGNRPSSGSQGRMGVPGTSASAHGLPEEENLAFPSGRGRTAVGKAGQLLT